jgi:hypothetical protein
MHLTNCANSGQYIQMSGVEQEWLVASTAPFFTHHTPFLPWHILC